MAASAPTRQSLESRLAVLEGVLEAREQKIQTLQKSVQNLINGM